MKLSLHAACVIAALLAAARGAAATPKAPVDPTCPIVVKLPTSSNFAQSKGGYVNFVASNPGTTAINNVVITFSLAGTGVTGGNALVALPLGATSPPAAKRASGAKGATYATNGVTVTYTIATIQPGQKLKLGFGLRIDPGVKRSNVIAATTTYTGPTGAACNVASNNFAIATRITPVGAIQSTSAKPVTYQQYANTYRVCKASLQSTAGSTIQACATACDGNKACTAFTMDAVSTCRLYTGNVGGGNPPQALLYENLAGSTIFLKSSKPKQINGSGGCPPL